MKAVQFDLNLPKYTLTKAAGKLNSSFYTTGPFTCLQFREVEKPPLPGEEWVEIEVACAGICGSDLNLISLKDSPSASPFTSFPFTVGHEMMGTVSKTGRKAAAAVEGDRVIIDPVLGCKVRGISPLCQACRRGHYNLCRHMNSGSISPGLLTGTCKDTGGSWSRYVVAHESQIIHLPPQIDDLNGLLIEPFSCALHTVLNHLPKPEDTVFVIGAGVIGICTVAAIRALQIPCRIAVLAKYPFQAEAAFAFGADHVFFHSSQKDYISEAARSFKAEVLNPVFGAPVVNGGADIVFECAGNKGSLQDALRFAGKGGTIALLGLASTIESLDMTMVWLNELTIKGSFAYGTDNWNGTEKRTLEMAVDLIADQQMDLSPLITHSFPLARYREAIAAASNKKKHQSMKVILKP